MLAKEADAKPDRNKVAIFFSTTGPEALERYNHFLWEEPPTPEGDNALPSNILIKDLCVDVFKCFQLEFAGEKQVVFSRSQFWERSEGQCFGDYVIEIHTLSQACKFHWYTI